MNRIIPRSGRGLTLALGLVGALVAGEPEARGSDPLPPLPAGAIEPPRLRADLAPYYRLVPVPAGPEEVKYRIERRPYSLLLRPGHGQSQPGSIGVQYVVAGEAIAREAKPGSFLYDPSTGIVTLTPIDFGTPTSLDVRIVTDEFRTIPLTLGRLGETTQPVVLVPKVSSPNLPHHDPTLAAHWRLTTTNLPPANRKWAGSRLPVGFHLGAWYWLEVPGYVPMKVFVTDQGTIQFAQPNRTDIVWADGNYPASEARPRSVRLVIGPGPGVAEDLAPLTTEAVARIGGEEIAGRLQPGSVVFNDVELLRRAIAGSRDRGSQVAALDRIEAEGFEVIIETDETSRLWYDDAEQSIRVPGGQVRTTSAEAESKYTIGRHARTVELSIEVDASLPAPDTVSVKAITPKHRDGLDLTAHRRDLAWFARVEPRSLGRGKARLRVGATGFAAIERDLGLGMDPTFQLQAASLFLIPPDSLPTDARIYVRLTAPVAAGGGTPRTLVRSGSLGSFDECRSGTLSGRLIPFEGIMRDWKGGLIELAVDGFEPRFSRIDDGIVNARQFAVEQPARVILLNVLATTSETNDRGERMVLAAEDNLCRELIRQLGDRGVQVEAFTLVGPGDGNWAGPPADPRFEPDPALLRRQLSRESGPPEAQGLARAPIAGNELWSTVRGLVRGSELAVASSTIRVVVILPARLPDAGGESLAWLREGITGGRYRITTVAIEAPIYTRPERLAKTVAGPRPFRVDASRFEQPIETFARELLDGLLAGRPARAAEVKSPPQRSPRD